MLKLLGLLFLFVDCVFLGWNQSHGLKKRLELLEELKRLLLLLSGEIRCGHATLPEAFFQVGKKARSPYGEFFIKVSEELNGEVRKPLQEVFERQLKNLHSSGLWKEDLELLLDLGKALGYLDLTMQLSTLKLYEDMLDASIQKAAGEYGPKAKMYRYLGVLGGLFLVVLLV